MLCHLIWIQANEYEKNKKLIPRGIKENYEKIKILNKDIEIKTWSNKDILELIENNFEEYLNDFIKINDKRFICDLARLFILYKYGGIYVDVDQECLTSFEKFGINDKINTILCRSLENNRISNGFIFIREKKNDFIKTCIENYINDLRKREYFISACETINNTVKHLNYEPDIMLSEKNLKEKEQCQNIIDFFLSFHFFNTKGFKIMKSRYDNYYKDKELKDDLVEFV